jgi:hypothetical protein
MARNTTRSKKPKTIVHMTVALFHGKLMPPKFNPRRNITVPPITERLLAQSTARRPFPIGVLGVLMLINNMMMRNAKASHGRFKKNTHLQDARWVKMPPNTGPIAQAKAHIKLTMP